jgi:biopolymer transport protein ExbD
MKKLLVMAVGLLSVLGPMPGCAKAKPKGFKDLASEVTRNQNLREPASSSGLMITVTIDKEYKVFLNKESAGTTEDVSQLKEKLAQALERRRQAYRAKAGNGTPDASDESAQKVVFVRAPSSFKYGEVGKVIEAVKGVGGEPIGLRDPDADQ